MADPMLYLDNYFVTDINVKVNKEFKRPEGLIEMNPLFSKKIEKIDENKAMVYLKVSIESSVDKPFYGSITIQGKFTCEKYESTDDGVFLMNKTSLSILFPYLRQALSNVTTLLNVPTYVLPVINITKLFKD